MYFPISLQVDFLFTHFPPRKWYRGYMCFVNEWWNRSYTSWLFWNPDDQKQNASSVSEKARVFSLLTAFLCCYVRPALPSSCRFLFLLYLVDSILEIHPWSLCFHRDLLQVCWKEKITYLYFCSCRYTNPDHHLPALCPLWVGDNWLVIIRHYYGYYFHFKKSCRRTVQGTEGKAYSDRCIPPADRQSQ